MNEVRSKAAELFITSLPAITVPAVSEEREQFFYLFLHVDPMGAELLRAVRRLLPPGAFRRRLLARARAQLALEFDKHAGRARWDLSQRLDSVCRRFEVSMSGELDAAVDAIMAAARRAEELRSSSEAERDRRLAESEAAREAARHALSFHETGGRER